MVCESLVTVLLSLSPGDEAGLPQLLAVAARLRDTAELLQSDEMRPANDPEERAPVRVRMLNDVLQGLEKSFLVHQVPPGLYRYGTRCSTPSEMVFTTARFAELSLKRKTSASTQKLKLFFFSYHILSAENINSLQCKGSLECSAVALLS